MAGRFVYWMNASLDLRIEPADSELGGGEWLQIDEALHREFNDRARALSVFVEGRVIYEIMEAYWPAAREDETMPGFLREYGEIWTTKPKVLVSRTRTSAQYNTEIVSDDAIGFLAELRAQADGDIGIGGANLATQLLAAGLLDELLLFTHPVLLGEGRPLFDRFDGPLQLELVEQAALSNGVTLHRYEIGAGTGAGARAAV